jgi:L-aspartate oxidase
VPFAFVARLVVEDGRVRGVVFNSQGKNVCVTARATLIASGGAGQVYLETTNPPVATGDGFALGYRAGALLRDMEFVQFHPTALKLPNLPPFLISEAIRGEGAHLITSKGERFVDELAPRDVVARAIYERLRPESAVFLDMRHLSADSVRNRFPSIHAYCLSQGFDITKQPVPVVPAAHYFMGGLYTDLDGKTTVPGLYAAGESASVGIHGANRLASNSLLECVVFGRRAAAAMLGAPQDAGTLKELPADPIPVPGHSESARSIIREAAWLGAGIVRRQSGMQEALSVLDSLERTWEAASMPPLEKLETANLLLVARLILQSALVRMESRGAHYRADHPERDDPQFGRHSWSITGKKTVIGSRPS